MIFRPATRKAALLLASMAASAMFGCSATPDTVEPGLQVAKSGVVLDETRQPVEGAYVVVRWLEQSQANGKIEGQCLSRAVVRTDKQGRYAIPASNFAIAPQHAETRYFWDVYAYTPGYADLPARAVHPRAMSSATPGDQHLEPIVVAADHDAPEQRIGTLVDTFLRFSCRPFAEQAPSPVVEQIYAEAYAAACLPEPNNAVSALARLRGGEPADNPCEQFRQVSNTR